MADQTLNVIVLSPQDILFQGPALSVSSKNSAGNFDMIPQHAKLITIIENNPIVIRQPNRDKITFKFPLAIIYITNNKVSIYAQPEITPI
ncbi:MAG: hypothetical protein Q7R49_03235 [Candidatus Daviesbacteria bacterium]|nr:hypothetical protein [Candidatus Daviesbacteria bacterium]